VSEVKLEDVIKRQLADVLVADHGMDPAEAQQMAEAQYRAVETAMAWMDPSGNLSADRAVQRRPVPFLDPDAERYGFEWPAGVDGARLQVTRLTSIYARRILRIATEHCQVQVSVSPTGREMQFYGDVRVSAR
jgi:hypothetical protein